MSAGAPIPTHGQAFAAFSDVHPNSRVYGIARELVSRGIGTCDRVEQMAFIETAALLAHAIELAGVDENRDSHEY